MNWRDYKANYWAKEAGIPLKSDDEVLKKAFEALSKINEQLKAEEKKKYFDGDSAVDKLTKKAVAEIQREEDERLLRELNEIVENYKKSSPFIIYKVNVLNPNEKIEWATAININSAYKMADAYRAKQQETTKRHFVFIVEER